MTDQNQQNNKDNNFPKHLLSIADLSKKQILAILQTAAELKTQRKQLKDKPAPNNPLPNLLKGLSVGVLTSKPSLRTRLSFEVAIQELGGHSLFIKEEEIGLNSRESIADIARVVSRLLSAMIVRTHSHAQLCELAHYSDIPIINALTEAEHPCQVLADLLTLEERFSGQFNQLEGLKLCYVGDGNNVATSLMLAASIMGIQFSIVSPPGHEPAKKYVDQATHLAKQYKTPMPNISNNLTEASKADVLYADVWVSMGQERQEPSQDKSRRLFAPYQINRQVTEKRIPVLHCLPAHKDEEISLEVFEDNADLIFEQAENRLHAQKALLCKLLN